MVPRQPPTSDVSCTKLWGGLVTFFQPREETNYPLFFTKRYNCNSLLTGSITMALRKVLTTPSRLASDLDWKKVGGATILSMDINKDRIGIAVACHPSYGHEVSTLEPFPITKQRGEIDRELLLHLNDVVKDYKVCGVVISWPVQQETGKMGAACGRVLHTVEDLLRKQQQKTGNDSSSDAWNIISPKRPLCFWNRNRISAETPDKWGRCPSYAASPKTERLKNQVCKSGSYSLDDENAIVTDVWDDFCRAHWPMLYEQNQSCSQKEKVDDPALSTHTKRKGYQSLISC